MVRMVVASAGVARGGGGEGGRGEGGGGEGGGGAKRGAERTCEKRPNDLVSDGTPVVVDEGRPVGVLRGPFEVVTAEDGGDETEQR